MPFRGSSNLKGKDALRHPLLLTLCRHGLARTGARSQKECVESQAECNYLQGRNYDA